MSVFNNFSILIVDDNPNNLFTLRALLSEHLAGIQIIEAQSGQEALRLLLIHPIDLILLDVQMPEMDGFETAELILSLKQTAHIPIVFLSAAYKSEEFQRKGFEVGAADYLTKPIDTPQLISKVRLYLRFIAQEHQHNLQLEQKVAERTQELQKARDELEQRVIERTQALQTANEQLMQAKDVAEQANLSKSRFLANMSHELRTPLNAIIGYSEMLLEEAMDEADDRGLELDDIERSTDIERILLSGKHLLDLINGVLDISKIEAGRMTVFYETFNVVDLLEDIISTVYPMVEKNNNQLEMHCMQCDGQAIEMHSDMTKVRQVLMNLLSNACKFTHDGSVSIYVDIHQENNEDFILFRIQDTGIGLDDDQKAKIFEPFTQADVSTTRKYGGTGLGLAITKYFTQLLGGHVEVESALDEGSIFKVYFPIQAPPVEVLDTSE